MNNKPSPVSYLLFHFLHQPCSIQLCNKKIKADICSATNPTALPRKLKIAPTTLPTIAAFLVSLLIAFASFVNHFFKALSSFGRGNPEAVGLTPPPTTHVIARAIVEMIIERDESIDIILILCSRNRIWIRSAKDLSSSRTFSMVCLILAIWVCRSSRVSGSISRFACLSLCHCLCSSEHVGSSSTPINFLLSFLMRLTISLNFETLFTSSALWFARLYQYLKIATYQCHFSVMLLVS